MEYITSEYTMRYSHGKHMQHNSKKINFLLNFFKYVFSVDYVYLVRPCIFSSFIIFVIPIVCFLAVERLLN